MTSGGTAAGRESGASAPADSGAAGSTGDQGAALVEGGSPGAGGAAADDPTASASADAGGTAAQGGATGSPLVLASVGTYSGPLGAAWGPLAEALEVWTRDVNARGGISGHPVELVVVDDGGDPARHFSAVRDLVETRNVFAFVGNGPRSGENQVVVQYLQDHGVPIVGGDMTTPAWQTSPMFFPQGTTSSDQTRALPAAAVRMRPDLRAWGQLTCRESNFCLQAGREWPQHAEQMGLSVVYRADVSIAQPDFTAECLRARDAGVELLAVAVDPNSVRRLAQSCSRLGYHPTYMLPSAVVSSGQDGDANLDGAIGVVTNAPWTATEVPAVADLLAAVERYAPDLTLNAASTMGWSAAKLVEAAAAAAGGLGPTPAREPFVEALYQLREETLGGVSPPLTYQHGQEKRIACWFAVEFGDGAWQEANNGRHDCP